ncbi:HEPN domain-containing protein [Thermus sp.]|uniref:HEPN domain-containing protein n=1 Tax=Thermus sp. TaxID=275 RepID=UPI00307F00B2
MAATSELAPAAQQGAEKAVKALHLGQEAWGHLIARLLKELPLPVPEALIGKAQYLDSLSIPTRYPEAFPEGPSAEHHGPLQGQEALAYARAVLAFTRAQMARP